jgi:hypothetical protein
MKKVKRGELMEKQYERPMEFRHRQGFMTVEEETRRMADIFSHALLNEQQKYAIIIF